MAQTKIKHLNFDINIQSQIQTYKRVENIENESGYGTCVE